MRPKIRIAEPEGFSDAALRRLQTVADVRLEPCAPGALSNALQETDVFWFRLGHRIDAEVLGERPRCRILATPVTGLDHIDLEACAARGVRVVSLKGEYEFLREVRATAELAVGLALALLRHIPRAAADVLEGHWRRDRFRGRELYHKTAGIVGVGRLGGIVAEYLAALGMEVLGYDPRPDLPACVERVATLDELFARCDLVSVHAVYQADTHHLIDAQVLAASRP
ncbi:MAG: NAD(P)-dependent oxidoreductase, partial [Acidobacteriota bacterium]